MAYHAFRRFQPLVEGRSCTLFMDHPRAQAVHHTWLPRQQQHLTALTELCSNFLYLPGDLNPIADCLSWAPVSTITLGVDYHELASH